MLQVPAHAHTRHRHELHRRVAYRPLQQRTQLGAHLVSNSLGAGIHGKLAQPLDLGAQEHARLQALDLGDDALECALRDLLVDADRHYTETGALS